MTRRESLDFKVEGKREGGRLESVLTRLEFLVFLFDARAGVGMQSTSRYIAIRKVYKKKKKKTYLSLGYKRRTFSSHLSPFSPCPLSFPWALQPVRGLLGGGRVREARDAA